MRFLTDAIRKQFTIRPAVLALCIAALAASYLAPALASGTATEHHVHMIMDDVSDTSFSVPTP